MAHHQPPAHPYHLVDPSPLPILVSFSLLAVVVGLAMYMHDVMGGGVLLGLGILAVIACAWSWWRAVIREGIEDKAHTGAVQTGLRVGMALFIASELMFFVAFFWAFFSVSIFPHAHLSDMEEVWTAVAGVWPPEGITTFDPWDLPLINTLVLLLSGTTVTWAHHALLQGKNDEVVQGLTITVILGFLFTCLQALEYSHATFSFTDKIYASTFYMATGFHGVHVIIGTIFLLVNLIRAKRGTLTRRGHLGFEFAAWYWHFVDVVWLFLFVFVYIWGA